MECADTPRAGAFGDGHPVDQTEGRRGQAADQASGHGPERKRRQVRVVGREVEHIEEDCSREQAERIHDQHRMHRVAEELDSSLHH
jgi:hypothetical protein